MAYDAFITYRRSDGAATARWLRRELQRFRAPRRLERHRNRELKVYLDIAYERGTTDFYEHTIRPALMASRHLIVLATPAAVRRPRGSDDWIVREVDDFTAGPNGGNVMVARAAGPLDGPLPAGLQERFPNIEIVDLTGVGRFWFLSPVRASRITSEKLKLIAPLLDLLPAEMPILRQEEERAQQVRIGSVAGIGLGVLIAVAGLSVYALRSQWRAQIALDSSMYAASQVIVSVTGQSDRRSGDRVFDRILNLSCDLLDKLSVEAFREPRAEARMACLTDRGMAREQRGETAEAERHLKDAIDLGERRYTEQAIQAVAIAIIKARAQLVELYREREDLQNYDTALVTLARRAQALAEEHEESSDLQARAARIHWDLAVKQSEADDFDAAFETAEHAVRLAAVASEGGDRESTEWRADRLEIIGNARLERAETDLAIDAYERSLQGREPQLQNATATVSGQLAAARTMVKLARLLVPRGDKDRVDDLTQRANSVAQTLEADKSSLSDKDIERLVLIRRAIDGLKKTVPETGATPQVRK